MIMLRTAESSSLLRIAVDHIAEWKYVYKCMIPMCAWFYNMSTLFGCTE